MDLAAASLMSSAWTSPRSSWRRQIEPDFLKLSVLLKKHVYTEVGVDLSFSDRFVNVSILKLRLIAEAQASQAELQEKGQVGSQPQGHLCLRWNSALPWTWGSPVYESAVQMERSSADLKFKGPDRRPTWLPASMC